MWHVGFGAPGGGRPTALAGARPVGESARGPGFEMEQRAGEPRAARLTIAMLGTRGVPARYGGFETAVEEVGQRLASRGHDVRVYCREGPDAPQPTQYKGMQLVWLPALHRRSMETLSHTGASVAHLLAAPTDVAFVFNCANAAWLPALRAARIPVATHVDGLEWKRAKWGGAGRRYYRIAEAGAVRLSDALIADAPGIADYYREEFDAPTELISYGSPVLCDVGSERLAEVGVRPQDYHLVVARLEPENHVDLMVDGFMRSRSPRQLVVVGSAPYADEYSARVHALAGSDPRVRFLGGVWDQVLLDQLYAHAFTYLHGHSVGGTNPSLLRAIGVGTPCVAYDVSFNRDVLEDEGVYVGDRIAVTAAIEAAEADPVGTAARGARLLERAKHYDWDEVADAYENLAWALAEHHTPGPHRGGRRHHTRHLPMSADPSPAHVGRRG